MRLIESKSVYLRTNQVHASLWRELNLYTNSDYTKDFIRQLYPGIANSLLETKVLDIHFCIKQAKDYFDSAAISSLISRPTLIYYGMVSLVAALVIMRDRDKQLNNMPQSHGLSMVYPNNPPRKRETVLSLEIKPNTKGTFIELIRLAPVDRFTIKWSNNISSEGWKTFKQEKLFSNLDETLLFRDIIKYIPEIWHDNMYVIKDQFLYPGETYVRQIDGFVENYIRINKNKSNVSNIIDKMAEKEYNLIQETIDNIYLKHKSASISIPYIKTSIFGETYIVEPDIDVMPDIILNYLAFFALGSLARYQPTLWGSVINNMKENFHNIIENFCDLIAIKFPLLIINEMNDVNTVIKEV